jgi:hypothetical protein
VPLPAEMPCNLDKLARKRYTFGRFTVP